MIFNFNCPTYSLTSTTSSNICSGSDAIITLAGGAGLPDGSYVVTYTRTINSVTITDSVTQTASGGSMTLTFSGLTAGTYNYTITRLRSGNNDQFGCFNSISLNNTTTFTVNPTPNAGTINGASILCAGTNLDTLTLTGSVGTIQWESSTTSTTCLRRRTVPSSPASEASFKARPSL